LPSFASSLTRQWPGWPGLCPSPKVLRYSFVRMRARSTDSHPDPQRLSDDFHVVYKRVYHRGRNFEKRAPDTKFFVPAGGSREFFPPASSDCKRPAAQCLFGSCGLSIQTAGFRNRLICLSIEPPHEGCFVLPGSGMVNNHLRGCTGLCPCAGQ